MTTITVTAEHIAAGEPGECAHCPVALAIRDALPDVAGVAVGPEAIGIRPAADGPWTELETPGDVVLFVMAYDDGNRDGPVHPFSFDLAYPAVTSC